MLGSLRLQVRIPKKMSSRRRQISDGALLLTYLGRKAWIPGHRLTCGSWPNAGRELNSTDIPQRNTSRPSSHVQLKQAGFEQLG